MTTYEPQVDVLDGGRPPCANCGAQLRLHRLPPTSAAYATPLPRGDLYLTSRGMQALFDAGEQLLCPEAYRPSVLTDAITALAAANDRQAVFAARGEVQRLMGHRPAGAEHCAACWALTHTA